MTLDPQERIDIEALLQDLEHYRPRRRGWHWRVSVDDLQAGPFSYSEASMPLQRSVPLPSAKYFGAIDPQPRATITTEIASGRFEDDIRRMRMAAWHGADHIMVIRTAGQSHVDGLLEGTPQGVGGVPITRKQVRAHRKALDLIEDEVGRPINYHSYVSGVAGPEIAVMFAEEGVNGAHQDPQYNVLYRDINMVRSFVDACEAKCIMAWGRMAQIDGAHNANATAREAWKVTPELLVQHAINTGLSRGCGIEPEMICLSSVPPTAPPAPALALDLPYAIALRDLFSGYRIRAQMNTKYMEASTREATVTHVLNLLVSELTSADIQSTITPDEGRNVPWHIYNIEACDTARQTFNGMDGLRSLVQLQRDGALQEQAREIRERAVLFLEEIIASGGYFNAVEQGFFVDSGHYPERHGDGIKRSTRGGIGADTVFPRDADYLAPVTAHFGRNNPGQLDPRCIDDPSALIDGCTLEDATKIIYIDELDETDNVNLRLAETAAYRHSDEIRPEAEWCADGTLLLTLFLPVEQRVAEAAALELAKKMGLTEAEVINREVMHPAEGTRIELKARVPFGINRSDLVIAPEPERLTDDEIRQAVSQRPMRIVAGTLGEDEHSVGLREIIDIKHGGIEKYGIQCSYLGTSVAIAKILDAAVELDADAILASVIISHDDVHYSNMRRLHQLAVEKGVRDRLLLIAGGTQVIPEMAREAGMDAGFGRGTRGAEVATFLVQQCRTGKV